MALRVVLRPSFLFAASARPLAGPSTTTMTRSFGQTRSLGLKESSSEHPNPDEIHKHVHDSLSKQKQGRGHWKPELASESEESVRADREFRHQQQHSSSSSSSTTDPTKTGGGGSHNGSGAASEAHIKELQERTKSHAEEKSQAGTSVREG